MLLSQTNVLMKLNAQELNSLERIRVAKEVKGSSGICLFSGNKDFVLGDEQTLPGLVS